MLNKDNIYPYLKLFFDDLHVVPPYKPTRNQFSIHAAPFFTECFTFNVKSCNFFVL